MEFDDLYTGNPGLSTWTCPHCETVNAAGEAACELCGAEIELAHQTYSMLEASDLAPLETPVWQVPGRLKYTRLVKVKDTRRGLRKRGPGKMSKYIGINLAAMAFLAITIAIHPGFFVLCGIFLAIAMEYWRKKKKGIFYKEPEEAFKEIKENVDRYEAGHRKPVMALSFDEQSENVLSVDEDNRVCIWDARSGAKVRDFQTTADLRFPKFPGPKHVFGLNGQSLRVWDHSGKRKALMPTWVNGYVSAHHASKDGTSISLAFDRGSIGYWRPGNESGFILPSEGMRKAKVVQILSGNEYLLSAHGDNIIQVWDLKKKEVARAMGLHAAEVLAITQGPLPGQFASMDATGKLCIADARTGSLIQEIELGTPMSRDGVNLAWAPDGKTIAIADGSPSVKIWDLELSAMVRRLEGEATSFNCINFSPDGRMLAAGGFPHHLTIWKV